MSQRRLISLTTLPTQNEQSGTTPATFTTTSTSKEYREFARFQRAKFWLNIQAISGTPTLTVDVQAQDPLALTWVTIGLTGMTGLTTTTATSIVNTAELYDTNYRVVYTIGGASPSFTLSFCAVVNVEEPIIRQ
jgi:hypothetical protein